MRCYFFLPLLALLRELEALAVLLAALLRDAAARVLLDLDAEALLALAREVLDALGAAAFAVDLTGVSLGAVALPATTSLKPCPARTRGTLVAFTLTGSPLRGLRAVRALRSCRSKVPKPTSATRSPFFTATCVCWIRLPSTLSTSVRATAVCFWIASTSSLRFKGASLPSKGISPVGTGPHSPVPFRPSIVKTRISKVNNPGRTSIRCDTTASSAPERKGCSDLVAWQRFRPRQAGAARRNAGICPGPAADLVTHRGVWNPALTVEGLKYRSGDDGEGRDRDAGCTGDLGAARRAVDVARTPAVPGHGHRARPLLPPGPCPQGVAPRASDPHAGAGRRAPLRSFEHHRDRR